MILDWRVNDNNFQFDGGFSLNFDYHDINLSIPQLAMTPKSTVDEGIMFTQYWVY